VHEIKKVTQMHRTTIYDFLDSLLNKGLVSSVKENNVTLYHAKRPEKLLNFLKEKERNLRKILPELANIEQTKKEKVQVCVYKGFEGFKYLLTDIINEGKELISFGVDESIFEENFPDAMQWFFQQERAQKMRERILVSEKAKFCYSYKHIHYKFIPKDYFVSVPTLVYGNKVANVIWGEPITIIIVESTALAKSHKKHFELLWKIAKEKI
jgi:sugar-specific transcriptional regulator TrmB